ncbi:MAG TPA: ACT domain-containing protein [Candidatus Brocadiia bacterium]|nr:ACT domain-containing protein [Planctomycetota bacterium]MBI4007994.1 ACT domain-containing protein [Planctomycetota bacterium]MDO8092693.1 ACT domain-containing protein [Candidatus Brocadiales bacterium]
MPIVKQLTVLIENKPGALADICSILALKKINIFAFSVADTIDTALLRIVVSDPTSAKAILKEAGHTVLENEVLMVDMPNRPGALAESTRQLSKARINIEYAYGSVGVEEGKGIGILWVSDLKKASEIVGEWSKSVALSH